MSLVQEILKELWNTELHYKGMAVNLFGIPRFKDHSKNSIRGTVFYLRKNGIIEGEDGHWCITPKGRKHMQRKFNSLKQFNFKFKKDEPKNLIVMFDVPEPKKAAREWLRWHLKKFNYVMIQKSVWVGPSPLPKDFLDYVKKIDLKDSIKTFKLAKGYKENNK